MSVLRIALGVGLGVFLMPLALGLLILAAFAAFWAGPATPLGAVLFRLNPALLNTAQAGIQRHVSPGLWDNSALPLLEQPAWLAPLLLGGLFLLVPLLLDRLLPVRIRRPKVE